MTDEGSSSKSSNRTLGKIRYERFNEEQMRRLEEYFQGNSHPNVDERRQLAQELGIQAKKINFWFQNRRTQLKVAIEREEARVLQEQNEEIQQNNLYLAKVLENPVCKNCSLSQHKQISEINQREKEALKDENAKLHQLIYGMNSQQGILGHPIVTETAPTNFGQTSQQQFQYVDKSIMLGIALKAMDEATRLLKYNEPLWLKDAGGRYSINHDSYLHIYPKPGLEKFEGSFESSKSEELIRMPGKDLVDILLDTSKWADFFSTLVLKAQTVNEFNSGATESRDGCLKLIHTELHILSHLVGARDLLFVRYCKQISEGVWVIADVTDEYFFDVTNSNTCASWCWKLPSGCMIQDDAANGCCKVTWMEHSKFKEHATTHELYTDYVNRQSAYGAERWLDTLHRSADRLAYTIVQVQPNPNTGRFISDSTGPVLLRLANLMIRRFCDSVALHGSVKFEDISQSSDSGVQLSFHKGIVGQPRRTVIGTFTQSFWLPRHFEEVFNFLMDKERRPEWDTVSQLRTLQPTVRVSTGNHPQNCISILQHEDPNPKHEGRFALLQETYVSPLGFLMVYAPLDWEVLNGESKNRDVLLPSGFLVTQDGYYGPASRHIGGSDADGANCSLVTRVYQKLAADRFSELKEESIKTSKAVAQVTTQEIKEALGCDFLDESE